MTENKLCLRRHFFVHMRTPTHTVYCFGVIYHNDEYFYRHLLLYISPSPSTNTCTQVLVFFIITTLLILAYAAELKQVATYERIVEQVCGPFFRILAELCIVVFCFGCATTFLVVIGDQTVDSE